MKHLFKKIPIVFALIVVSFLYFSCTQEKEYVNEKNRKDVIFKEKTFDEVLKMPMFNEAYQKLTKKKGFITNSSTARTALEDQFGFTIDPELVKIIETSYGKISYNMLITRDTATTGYFENLIIEVDSLNNADAFIIKYHPTEPMREIAYHNSFTFVGEKEIQHILASGRFYWVSYGCYSNTTYWCSDLRFGDPNHPEWEYTHVKGPDCDDWDFITRETTVVCVDGVIEGGDTEGSNVTVTEGGEGGNTETINTAIVPCGGCIEVNDFDCEDLANHVDPTKGNIKPGIDWLKSIISNPLLNKYEFGTNYKKLADTTGSYNYTNQNVGDLELLLDMYDTAGSNRKPEVVLILVCRHPNPLLAALGATITYALKVNDIEKLRNAITAKKNSSIYNGLLDKDKNLVINNELASWYSRSLNKEKTFLQFFGNYGVNVYKANDNLTNWSKLILQPDATGVLIVNQIPCL